MMLLKETPVNLPLLNAELPITGFYRFAPYFYLLIHFNLLLQLCLLSDKLHGYNAALSKLADIEARKYYDTRLFPFAFSHTLSGTQHSEFLKLLLTAMVWITMIWLPLCLLIGLQVGFLAYHSEQVLELQRWAIVADLGILTLFWPIIRSPDGKWMSWVLRATGISAVLSWINRRFFSTTVVNQPGFLCAWVQRFNTRSSGMPIFEGILSFITLMAIIGFSYGVAVLPESDNEKWVANKVSSAAQWFDSANEIIGLGEADEKGENPAKFVDAWLSVQPLNKKGQPYFRLTEWLFDRKYLPVKDDAGNIQQGKWDIKQPRDSIFHRNLRLREKLLIANELKPEDIAALMYDDKTEREKFDDYEKERNRAINKTVGLILRGRDLRYADFTESLMPNIDFQAAFGKIDSKKDEGEEGDSQKVNGIPTDLSYANFDRAKLFKARMNFAQLQGADLREAQLQGAKLIGALLQGSNLSSSQLQGAKLFKAQLQGANLIRAKLQGADLIGAQLQGANLSSAELKGADLRWAQLQGADLRRAKLQGVNLSSAELKGADLRLAQLQGADLSEARLQGADLREAELQGAKLIGALLQGADLKEAQLQGADLENAELQGADLEKAQLQGADLSEARLQGADLREAELQGAKLIGALLQGADLSLSQLQGADLREAELQGANLLRAKLQGADLSIAQLQGADLSDAWLQGADLNWAKLQGADLRWARLQGADLNYANLTLSDITKAKFGKMPEKQSMDLFKEMSQIIKDPRGLEDLQYRLSKAIKSPATLAKAKGQNIWPDKSLQSEIAQKASKESGGKLEFAKSESDYQNGLVVFLIKLSCQNKWTASGIIQNTQYRGLPTSFALCLLSLKDKKNKSGLAVCPGVSEISKKDVETLKQMASKKEPENNTQSTFKCEDVVVN